MPELSTCLVCARPDLADIDAALDAGEGLNATARRFELSRGAVQRHAKHRDAKPAKASEATLEPEPFEPAGSSRLEGGSKVARSGSNPGMDVVADPPAAPPSAPRAPEPPPAPPAPPAEPPPPSEPAPASPGLTNVIAFPGPRSRVGKGRVCACCSSERRQEIDTAIASGMSYRGVERRYGVSDDSARHHATKCVPEALARAADTRAAAEAQTVETVLEEVTRLLTEARDALAAATADPEATHKDRSTWFRELRQTVELLAKLRGELVTTTNNYLTVFLNSKEWESARRAIYLAILPTPGTVNELTTRGQVMDDVIAALRVLDA
jgi:hypothetical protein